MSQPGAGQHATACLAAPQLRYIRVHPEQKLTSRKPGISAMTSRTAIDTAVDRMVACARPSKIILFGSRAQGTETIDSDLDFLVIESRVASKVKEMARLRDAIGDIGMAVDVLVYSEDEVAEWGALPGTALYWALKEGKVLYEAPC